MFSFCVVEVSVVSILIRVPQQMEMVFKLFCLIQCANPIAALFMIKVRLDSLINSVQSNCGTRPSDIKLL